MGHQTLIVAHLLSGRAEHALALVEGSTVQEPWEQVLRAVLDLWCRAELSDQTPLEVDDFRGRVSQAFDVSRPLFSTRLGLAALHLLHRVGAETAALTDTVTAIVLRAEDGYAARELLGSWKSTTAQDRDNLARVLGVSGLTGAGLPTHLHEQLTNVVTTAANRLDAAFPSTAIAARETN